VPKTAGPGADVVDVVPGDDVEYEERWTGGYIFENEWQSFRTRQNRALELTSAEHEYSQAGRYTVAVKVIDTFGNDTMTPRSRDRRVESRSSTWRVRPQLGAFVSRFREIISIR
jgi:hypothetical protein